MSELKEKESVCAHACVCSCMCAEMHVCGYMSAHTVGNMGENQTDPRKSDSAD